MNPPNLPIYPKRHHPSMLPQSHRIWPLIHQDPKTEWHEPSIKLHQGSKSYLGPGFRCRLFGHRLEQFSRKFLRDERLFMSEGEDRPSCVWIIPGRGESQWLTTSTGKHIIETNLTPTINKHQQLATWSDASSGDWETVCTLWWRGMAYISTTVCENEAGSHCQGSRLGPRPAAMTLRSQE